MKFSGNYCFTRSASYVSGPLEHLLHARGTESFFSTSNIIWRIFAFVMMVLEMMQHLIATKTID